MDLFSHFVCSIYIVSMLNDCGCLFVEFEERRYQYSYILEKLTLNIEVFYGKQYDPTVVWP
jgi:hypothetical protein